MARCIAWIYTFHCSFSAIWCVTLDPFPTVNVTRYNSQSFICSVRPDWSTVSYFDGTQTIAVLREVDGECKDFQEHDETRYAIKCDISASTFNLTINNVTDYYDRKKIGCGVVYGNNAIITVQTDINVQSIWCLTLDPSPTVNVTRYNSQSFICSGVTKWESVSYYLNTDNIAYLREVDGKCTDFAVDIHNRYEIKCDISTRTFTLTIKNVTDDYHEEYIQCEVDYGVTNRIVQTVINVQYQPTTTPNITQTPVGPIIEGNRVTLTCTIQGGNPVATITWSCDGATHITPTGSPSTGDAIFSVELVTSKANNGQICRCTGRHILWTNDKAQQHTITVYYKPTSTPSITQTPPGPINENSPVILTCEIQGGNPLATITWTCEGSSPINPTGSPLTSTTTSSVQLTVNGNDNGRICTCIGHHPLWTTDNTTVHKLDVIYQPTTSPNTTQTPIGPIIEGNTVTLTCTIEGGNPVATITWSCEGATQITPTGSPSTGEAISSVELVTSKANDGQICTCTGRHLLWTKDKIQQHTITVYYEPTSPPSITQTPPGPINSPVSLTCYIKGGNPLATITWTCEGSSPINPTGSPSTNTATSRVQVSVSSNDNGRMCTCIGHHPAWTTDKTTGHTIDVKYIPDPPSNVSVVCDTAPFSTIISWRSEFDGGRPQIFHVWFKICCDTLFQFVAYVDEKSDPGSNKYVSVEITGLQAATPYIFYVSSSNVYGSSRSTNVFCNTKTALIKTNEPSASITLFTAGISSLIIGLLATVFGIAFVVICRRRLQKQEQKRTNNYTEFTACKNRNPVVTDNYDSLNTTVMGPVAINETQTNSNINTYEECIPVRNTDHTYNNLNKQPKEKKKLKKKEGLYDNMRI